MVPINHTLQNGSIVEILTSPNASGPSIDWLKIAQSSHARNKIKAWLRKENKIGGADKVKEASNDEKPEAPKKSDNDIFSVAAERKKTHSHKKERAGVTVNGVDNLMIRISRCCNPVPGDEIVGFITKGRGISVHRKDCGNIRSVPDVEKQRLIDVEWDEEKLDKSYSADVHILSEDRKGLFSDLSRVCEDMDVHITGVNAKSAKDELANITMTLSISNTGQMEKVLRAMQNIPGVVQVYRLNT
jgi:GTP pyrophosphokinase